MESRFRISGASRRMWLELALDAFAIFALGAHEFVVQLEAEPEAGRAWGFKIGRVRFHVGSVAIHDFDFMGFTPQQADSRPA